MSEPLVRASSSAAAGAASAAGAAAPSWRRERRAVATRVLEKYMLIDGFGVVGNVCLLRW